MADVSLEFTGVADDRKSIVITDNTDFTDPSRSEVGVFVNAYKYKYNSTLDETLVATGDDADPETDSSWTITRTEGTVLKDGWIKIYYVAVPDYDAGETYDTYDAVFDPSTEAVYRSLQDGQTGNPLDDTDYWEEIEDPATLAANEGEDNESTNIDSTIYEIQLRATTGLAFGRTISDASIEGGDAEREQAVQLFELFAVWYFAEQLASTRSRHPDGEVIARRAEAYATQEELI